MKRIRARVALLALTAVAFADDAPKLPTVDEIAANMKAKWASLKSFEMEAKVTFQQDGKVIGEQTVHAGLERVEKDGKVVEKSFIHNSVETKDAAGEKVIRKSDLVNDGTYAWDSREEDGIPVVWKDLARKTEGQMFFWCGPGMVTECIKAAEAKVTGEENIGGQKMYVLEGEMMIFPGLGLTDNRLKESWGRWKAWIGQDDRLVHRLSYPSTHTSPNHLYLSTMDIIKVKVNEKMDAKLFEFVPPIGAQMHDATVPKATP